jgi:hypothetical protein
MIAYFIRFDTINFPVDEELAVFKTGLPIYIGIRALSFFIFSTHRGIIRHTSVEDIKKVAISVTAGTGAMIINPKPQTPNPKPQTPFFNIIFILKSFNK